MRSLDEIARAVAAHGLATRLTLPADYLDDGTWRQLVSRCERERTLGLLAAAVEDGAMPATAEQARLLADVHGGWVGHGLRLERTLRTVIDALDSAGIDHRVFKGVALANTIYKDEPSRRVFADVDLLIPAPHFSRAAHVLEKSLPARRNIPELKPGFDERFGKERMLKTDDGLEVDLHRTLVEGALGLTVNLAVLFEQAQTFDLWGRPARALAQDVLFVQTCYAVALADQPIRQATSRDLVEVVNHTDLDPVGGVRLAEEWKAGPVVAAAVSHAWATLGLDASHPLATWARDVEHPRFDRLLLSAHVGPGRSYTRRAAALLVARTWRDRARLARAFVAPDRAHLAARDMTWWEHVRRGVSHLFRR